MKRFVMLLVMVLVLLCIIGCSKKSAKDVPQNENFENRDVQPSADEQQSSATTEEIAETERDAYFNSVENIEETFTVISEQDENFTVWTSESHAGVLYEVYDNAGNLLDKGYHNWRGSFELAKEGNLVVLEYGFGGTNVHPMYRVYDVEKGMVSRYFSGPIALKNGLISYFIDEEDQTYLVVQDIFDVGKYYQRFTGKFDHFIYMKIKTLAFSEDGSSIIIMHHETNNEANIITEEFEVK